MIGLIYGTLPPPRKCDVIPTLLLKAINLTSMMTKNDGGIPLKKARDVDPLILDPPRNTEGIRLVIRGDSKTTVDWINGKAKQKKASSIINSTQKQLLNWWKQEVDLSHRTADWAVHVFREHNTEADQWAAHGAKGQVLGWIYKSAIEWAEVRGICGSWDGSCDD